MIYGVIKIAKLNRAGRKHKRHEATKAVQPGNYLIVTDGTETEKYYKNIYDITFPYVNNAIKRSNSLLEDHRCDNISSQSKMNPATKVQDLVAELIKYINISK